MSQEITNSQCPACQSTKINTIDRLRAGDAISLYRRAINLDVSQYFDGVPAIALNQCATCDLRFYFPPCPGDGPFYEQLQQFDWYYQEEKAEYELASRYVSDGNSVLEVGCGDGAFRSWLPEAVDYIGLEINEDAVTAGQARGLQVIRQPVEEHVATTSRRYDFVCAFQVLEHIPNPAGFVDACVRALAPQGKLIFAVPAEDGFMGVGANHFLNMPPHHALRWSDRALRCLADRHGLEAIEIWHEPVAANHRELHANVLARYYFAALGLKPIRLIEKRWTDRMLRALLRLKPLRNACAARAMASDIRFAHGHTVALIATPREAACAGDIAGAPR